MARWPALVPLVLIACAHRPAGTSTTVDISEARARGGSASVSWASWSNQTFARARQQGRYVLVDGAAEWCHWCHVMDETTYRDPAVLRALDARWVTVRVDIDSRPDLAARYAAWGWPATVLFAPDGREIARYRGYQTPEHMLALLDAARTAVVPSDAGAEDQSEAPGVQVLSDDALDTLGPWVARAMDETYDNVQGSWGTWQKVALGSNLLFELRRASHGDEAALRRARYTLEQQRALIDPVWGGVCQYSAGSNWNDPHFEKLMVFQTGTIEATVSAWEQTRDADDLADAQRVAGFVEGFLTAPNGAFYASQDADVNAHDRNAPFVDGHVYQRLDDTHRRALGLPRVDVHIYARENGLAIAALAALARKGYVDDARARAVRAADYGMEHLLTPDGAVRRTPDADEHAPRYLADAAAFGLGLAALAQAVEGPQHEAYAQAARRIATGILRDFAGARGVLWDSVGVADGPVARGSSVDASVAAARLFAALWHATHEDPWHDAARRTLAAAVTPEAITGLGRDLGEVLLALDDAGAYPWEAGSTYESNRPGDHHVLSVRFGQGGLEVAVRPTEGEHLNTTYPVSLTLEALGAGVPAVMHRGEAVEASESRLAFRAAVTQPTQNAVIRGVLRFALCGTDTCLPRERWFTVTAPGEGRRAPEHSPEQGEGPSPQPQGDNR